MLRTEEEARLCWCPFVRVVGEPNHSENPANRWPDDEDAKAGTSNCCIASACMAWRWLPVTNEGELQSKIQVIKDRRQRTGCDLRTAKDWSEMPENVHLWQAAIPKRGWCGLAGEPR